MTRLARPQGLSAAWAANATREFHLFWTSLQPGSTPVLWHRHYQWELR